MDWEKQSDETTTAWIWFTRYLELGTGRSLVKLQQNYDKTPSYLRQLAHWSKENHWVERANAYDVNLQKKWLESYEENKLQAAKKHSEIADLVYDLVRDKLESLKDIQLKPAEWIMLAEFALKTKRGALDLATQIEVKTTAKRDPVAVRLYDDILRRTKILLGQEVGDDD
mgnify:CR=1 FL=1|jgi:hypothetical protein